MRRKGLLAVAVALLLALVTPLQAATPKAGAKCSKAGTTTTAAGKKFTCIKSGNKLVWNKGVAIKAAPKPSLSQFSNQKNLLRHLLRHLRPLLLPYQRLLQHRRLFVNHGNLLT
jgi:hypothetical protein